jgi:hypothetical protein
MALNLKATIASVKDKYARLNESDEAQVEKVEVDSTDSEVNDPVTDTAVDVAVKEGTFDKLFESYCVQSSAALTIIREAEEAKEETSKDDSEEGVTDIEGTEENSNITESFILREADEDSSKSSGSSDKEKGFFGKIWDKVVKAWNTLIAFVQKIFFRVKRFFTEKFGFYNRILKNEAAIKNGYSQLSDNETLKAGGVLFTGYTEGIKYDPLTFMNKAKQETNVENFMKVSSIKSVNADDRKAFLELKYTQVLGQALKDTLPSGVDYTVEENNVHDGINAYVKYMQGEKTTADKPVKDIFKSGSEIVEVLKAATVKGANKVSADLDKAVKEFKKAKEGIIKTFTEARKEKESIAEISKLAVKCDTVMRAICNVTMSIANAQVDITRSRAYTAYQVAKLCAKKGGATVEEEPKEAGSGEVNE